MGSKCFFLILLGVSGFLSSTAFCYPVLIRQVNVPLETGRTTYKISEEPILNHSETVFADTLTFYNGVDYQLDYRTGELMILRPLEIPDIHISFFLIPPQLRQPLQRYQVLSDSIQIARRRPPKSWIPDDGKLVISGSKTFAIVFSDDEAFELKQSLFVNLSGELAENVNISAQLSDSQSKLSPEGDSKELSSLDQVFIKVYGREYFLAMGDLEWEYQNTRFMNYKTKFEGLNAYYSKHNTFQAAYSASSGKRASQQITIIEGKQGPYFLRAGDFQQNFIIIAGSEAIFMEGTQLTRGLDYYIDYSDGSVTFKNIISSSSQVIAWFQYSDEYYRQNVFLSSSRIRLTDKLALSYHFINQADDRKTPLQYNFTSVDLDSLRLAGDRNVFSDGVVQSEDGSYIRLTDEDGLVYYEYSQNDSIRYNITFSYVGSGNGDYEEFSTGKFRWLGVGNGSWLPVKRLQTPANKSNINSILSYKSETLDIALEGLFSNHDKNTFSSIDDQDNVALLFHARASLQPDWDILRPNLSMDYEERSKGWSLFAETDTPDIEIMDQEKQEGTGQQVSGVSLAMNIKEFFIPRFEFRMKKFYGLSEQKIYRSTYRFLKKFGNGTDKLDLGGNHTMSNSRYFWEPASGTEFYTPNETNHSYHSVFGDLFLRSQNFRIEALQTKTEHDSDELVSDQLSSDLRYQRLAPSVTLRFDRKATTRLGYMADDNSTRPQGHGTWQRTSTSGTYLVKQAISTTNHNFDIDASHRSIRYSSSASANTSYSIVNLRTSNQFWKRAFSIIGNYQLNQKEFFPKIREFQYVGSGLGSYTIDTLYVSNGDYDYVFLTSDKGELSAEINGQATFYFKPASVFSSGLLKRIMTDISLQATEQTKKSNDLMHYLLFPNHAYTQDNTIYGRQSYTQNLWLDLVENFATGQLYFDASRTMDQRYGEGDFGVISFNRTFSQTRAIELNIRHFINYRARFTNKSEEDTRYQSVVQSNSLLLILQRFLDTQTSLDLELEANRENGQDVYQANNYTLQSISVKPTARSVWMQKYRVFGSYTLRYNDRSGSQYLSFLKDKKDGFISLWNLSAVYRLNAFSSATIEYSGDSYPGQKASHQLRIEFKAEL